MVLARGGLFREGAEGKDRYPRTQQASQNATRGHHTQTQDPEGLLWGHTFRGVRFLLKRSRGHGGSPRCLVSGN
jgi:hypothetical protein